MNHLTLTGIILFVIFIILSILTVLKINNDYYSDVKNEVQCKGKNPKIVSDGSACAIWDNNICKKGKINMANSTCTSGDIIGLILIILDVIIFISSLILFFMGIFKR